MMIREFFFEKSRMNRIFFRVEEFFSKKLRVEEFFEVDSERERKIFRTKNRVISE